MSRSAMRKTGPPETPELHTGDRMSQEEFHEVYKRMPENFKAELIGGIVYVASPLKLDHGTNDNSVSALFWNYATKTPGVQSSLNTTVKLGTDSEPQPDAFLRIRPEFGGQSRTSSDNYVVGAPELLAETALSSRAIDLHAKLDDYARYGALEYLVVCVKEKQLRWFDLQTKEELLPDADSVIRIRSFPGLWIHGAALLAEDYSLLLDKFYQGLATPEHTAFVQQLAKARDKKKRRRSNS